MIKIAGILCALTMMATHAMAAGLIEERVALQASFPGVGRSQTIALDALVVRPGGGARHPLVVINHGAPRNVQDRATMSPSAMRAQAREFARRGWVAVTFMRRGYGESEGDFAESYGTCDGPDYVQAGTASAQDVRAVIGAMSAMPYVDTSRVVSVGRSAGGFATVALTADPPPGLVAAINFAGGRGSIRPDEVCGPSELIKAFRTFGTSSRVPMLWVYSENDRFFSPTLARRFHKAFTSAGGVAELVVTPEFGDDGHNLFSEKGAPIWTPYTDAFLERQKLASMERPRAQRDQAKPPYPPGLGARGKQAFLKYLESAPHKAFVTAPNGSFGWRTGRATVDEAVEEATEYCEEGADECFAVMIDDRPVDR